MIYVHDRPLNDPCRNRHWSACSETFTGADSLVTALDRGYTIVSCTAETHACKTQKITVYVFTLEKEDEQLTMPIIANPYIERFVKRLNKANIAQAELAGA